MAKRRRRRNPGELMLLENPYMGGFDYLGGLNPKRRKHRRNPMARALALPAGWTQGVGLMDAAAAVAGLAASTMIPGMIVKTADTTGSKVLKLAVSLGAAIAAGMVFKRIAPGSSKAAVVGGMAGTVATALSMFTGIKIGGPLALPSGRRIGETTMISPSFTREGERVSMIQP